MAGNLQKVLLLTGDLRFRGSSLLLLRMARGLADRKIAVDLMCTQLDPLDAELTDGLQVREVRGYRMPVWGRLVRHTIWFQLQNDPPDIIHVHGPQMLTQALWLGRCLERPVVLTVTDQAEASSLSPSTMLRQLSCIVCVSESVRQALPAPLQSVEQRVIHPGVRLDLSKANPTVLPEGRAPVIGMAGPLEVMKGSSFFLRSCHRLIDAGRPIRIVVAGSGPEEQNLRRLATSLSLSEHITFVDARTSISVWMSALDVFCLPSLQQGFGVMLLEAMAIGRPVVASGVGGVLSFLEDGKNGLLVPPSDSRTLADKLSTLLDDAELARKIAIAGQNMVEDNFTLERMTNELIEMYDDLTGHSTSSVATLPIDSDAEKTATV